MGITNIGLSSNSTEYLRHVLAHIQNLCAKAAEEGATDKHQQIRVVHWLRKLRSQPTSNCTWLKNVLEYANVLLHMLLEGVSDRGAFYENAAPRSVSSTSEIPEPIRGAVGVVEKVNKQIQTQEQDDQWEWQRVWKGAFDKIRQQLRVKTEETETLTIENKELLALVAGYKKALDEAERSQRELEAKHLAEIENLRAVHS
ncbi:Hypothetical protein PHPALM_8305, partial [Phytophthora palmivora]